MMQEGSNPMSMVFAVGGMDWAQNKEIIKGTWTPVFN